MNLSSKHQNESMTTLQNFAGGLNTSSPAEMIDITQLARVVNMEINKAGLLQTVQGTRTLATFSNLAADIISAAFDSINNKLLLFGKDGTVYTWDGTLTKLGMLSGDSEVVTVCWEDGILIASGGHLQYAKYVVNDSDTYNTESTIYKLVTLTNSPNDCGGVYVRSGRVFIFDDEDNLRYSAIGDEESWDQDSNDPSTAIFTQIGYKVGGRIVGLINFQSYVLIIKDNGKIYRLENEYPDWAIKEVTSNGQCKGKAAFTSIGSNVFVLGDNILQSISPTDDYGNMPINQVGKQVQNEIEALPPRTKLRFNVELNQLWFITNSQWVLVFDCNTQTFFQRYFNSDVVDLVGNYVIKRNSVCELSKLNEVMTDDGKALEYRVKFKTEMSLHDILVKHVDISISPFVSYYTVANATINVGRINVSFPTRKGVTGGNKRRTTGVDSVAIEAASTSLADGNADVFLNGENISAGHSILYKKRQVCRCDRVDVELKGSGFPFELNFINYVRVEV